jgi:hypothetical protein
MPGVKTTPDRTPNFSPKTGYLFSGNRPVRRSFSAGGFLHDIWLETLDSFRPERLMFSFVDFPADGFTSTFHNPALKRGATDIKLLPELLSHSPKKMHFDKDLAVTESGGLKC